MVTRCALVLRMVHTPTGEPYALIRGGTGGSEARIALADVAQHVTRLTDQLAKPGEVSSQSIYLTVYSPTVPDLTLVDLPGIVYTDAEGRKSAITDSIHALYKQHIARPGCVILCVMPVNADARTQQVTAWAHEVDPQGERTLGVISKVDRAEADDATLGARLMGQGPNAWTFRLGAVALRCRTQAEVEAGVSRDSVDAAEQAVFDAHVGLRGMAPGARAGALGCAALVRRLVHIQTAAIQAYLPALQAAIRDRLAGASARAAALPRVCASPYECLAAFSALAHECAQRCAEAAAANYTRIHAFGAARAALLPAPGGGEPTNADVTAASAFPPAVLALHVMPRVQELCSAFAGAVRASAAPVFAPGAAGRLREALRECGGCSLPGARGEGALAELVARDAGALREPALALAAGVHDYTASWCSALVKEYFAPYPALAGACEVALGEWLRRSHARCVEFIEEQCAVEAEAYTLSGEYEAGLAAVRAWRARRAAGARASPCFVPAPWSDAVVGAVLEAGAAGGGEGAVPCGAAVAGAGGAGGAGALGEEEGEGGAGAGSAAGVAGALLDTQLALLCYRRVVHARFTDAVAGHVRLHFPRRLKEEIAGYLQRSILEGEEGVGSGGSGSGGKKGGAARGVERLAALMAEPASQGAERAALAATIAGLTKAQRELRRGGLAAVAASAAAGGKQEGGAAAAAGAAAGSASA